MRYTNKPVFIQTADFEWNRTSMILQFAKDQNYK